MAGPLRGLKVVEFAGLGPAPFAAMLLADMGAEVVRIDRPATAGGDLDPLLRPGRFDLLGRGKRSIAIDLKHPEGAALAARLAGRADVVIEGFRPGVMERLGLGPDVLLGQNPRLVFGRMTGWGQHGPLAHAAGHDINFLALSGALHLSGRAGAPPVAPPAMLGDFGGGALFLAFGIVAAVLEARGSGRGQVVDAAVVDGSSMLTTLFHGLRQAGLWSDQTGRNPLDSGAHFYDTYECRGGGYIAVGALEEHFFRELLERTGQSPELAARRFDRASWSERKQAMAEVFRTRTRDEWAALLEGSDACAVAVLNLAEAPEHAHARARQAHVEVDGVVQPAPAPRFSRTAPATPAPAPRAAGSDTRAVLAAVGCSASEIEQMLASGAVHQADGSA